MHRGGPATAGTNAHYYIERLIYIDTHKCRALSAARSRTH